MKVLAATGNKDKIIEFAEILSGSGVVIVSPADAGGIPDTEETGGSFEENACLKAVAAAKFANMPAMSDDSGLEVEALGNAPGVMSSRYADDDAGRISRVLNELEDVETRSGLTNRRARFVCVIALASPEGLTSTFRGEVCGMISREPRGDRGFGYDPVFIPDGYSLTFGELASTEKSKVSHRARALAKAAQFIMNEAGRS